MTVQIPKIAEDGSRTYVDVGPGRHGFPQLVPMVESFVDDVKQLLYGSLADQVCCLTTENNISANPCPALQLLY